MRCWDLNPQHLNHESPPATTGQVAKLIMTQRSLPNYQSRDLNYMQFSIYYDVFYDRGVHISLAKVMALFVARFEVYTELSP